jgi:hypothetical protein
MVVKAFDIVIAALAVSLTAMSFTSVLQGAQGTALVNVQGIDGQWIYPIDEDRQLSVQGPLGATVVQIAAGEVRVVYSPCSNQVCVSAGAIRFQGHWTACLPNRVLLFLDSQGPSADVDAFSR